MHDFITSSQQEKELSAIIPKLQAELDVRENDLSSLRSTLSVLESRYGDAKSKLDSLQLQTTQMKEDYEQRLEQAQSSVEKQETVEMITLREANENLKVLLSGAEKKYMRISSLNLELQKKVDNLEQQSRMTSDQV